MYIIYAILNSCNNKLYIGKTNNFKRRWQEHKKVAAGGKEKYGKDFRVIHAAIAKYNINNFQHIIIEELEDEKCAFEMEKFWIEYFQSRKNGYNETPGGEGFLSGKNHPNYGTHPTKETLEKQRLARIGRIYPKGYKASLETKEKLSKMRKGKNNSMYGKHHTDESKKLISQVLIAKENIGEKHRLSTLTNDQANEIRKLFSEGMIKSKIAKLFNTKWLVVHRIISNETYSNNKAIKLKKEKNVLKTQQLAKLTDKQAIEIRNLYKNKEMSQKDICILYGISKPTYYRLIRNETYKDLCL